MQKTHTLATSLRLLSSKAVLFARLITIHDSTPHPAALNMALDEALLATAREPTLRIYRWENAAVSFGYFTRLSAVAPHSPPRELVRRMTGGGIVPHGTDLTYSLIVPAAHPFSQLPPRDSYRRIHETLAHWLAPKGITATIAPPPALPASGHCFESPVEYDLLAAHAKIAGAAQRRTRDGLLHQGSVQIAGLDATTLPAAFASECEARPIPAATLETAMALALSKYATAAWTARV